MALRTVVASGYWADAGTWNTGIPVDGDSFYIPGGFTVFYNDNHSAMASGMRGGIIDGTLSLSSVASSYLFKLDGNSSTGYYIGGSGYCVVGTSGSPVPKETTFKFDCGGYGLINGASGLTFHWYGEGPQYRWVETISSAASAATALAVNIDLTTDTYWTSGGSAINIWIGAYNAQGTFSNSVWSSITSITSSHVYINSASALNTTYPASSMIVLVHRNLSIQMNSVVSRAAFANFNVTGSVRLVLSGVKVYRDGFTTQRVWDASSGPVEFKGDTIVARSQYSGFNSGSMYLRERAIFLNIDRIGGPQTSTAPFSEAIHEDDSACIGCLQGQSYPHPWIIQGSSMIVSQRTISYGFPLIVRGNATIRNFREIVENAGVEIGPNVTVTDGGSLIRTAGKVTLYGTRVGYPRTLGGHLGASPVNFRGYGAGLNIAINNSSYLGQLNGAIGYGAEFSNNVTLYDVQDASGNVQPGRHKVWSSGGQIDPVTITSVPLSALAPYSYSFWHRGSYEYDIYYLYLDIPITVIPSTPITVTIHAINSVSGGYYTLPNFQLRDPACMHSETWGVVASAVMSDNAVWQTIKLSYTPTIQTSLDLRYFGSRSASAFTYWNYQVVYGNQRIKRLHTGGRM